jgi:hypothetical protein
MVRRKHENVFFFFFFLSSGETGGFFPLPRIRMNRREFVDSNEFEKQFALWEAAGDRPPCNTLTIPLLGVQFRVPCNLQFTRHKFAFFPRIFESTDGTENLIQTHVTFGRRLAITGVGQRHVDAAHARGAGPGVAAHDARTRVEHSASGRLPAVAGHRRQRGSARGERDAVGRRAARAAERRFARTGHSQNGSAQKAARTHPEAQGARRRRPRRLGLAQHHVATHNTPTAPRTPVRATPPSSSPSPPSSRSRRTS